MFKYSSNTGVQGPARGPGWPARGSGAGQGDRGQARGSGAGQGASMVLCRDIIDMKIYIFFFFKILGHPEQMVETLTPLPH